MLYLLRSLMEKRGFIRRRYALALRTALRAVVRHRLALQTLAGMTVLLF